VGTFFAYTSVSIIHPKILFFILFSQWEKGLTSIQHFKSWIAYSDISILKWFCHHICKSTCTGKKTKHINLHIPMASLTLNKNITSCRPCRHVHGQAPFQMPTSDVSLPWKWKLEASCNRHVISHSYKNCINKCCRLYFSKIITGSFLKWWQYHSHVISSRVRHFITAVYRKLIRIMKLALSPVA
jgi:hypothetical protein